MVQTRDWEFNFIEWLDESACYEKVDQLLDSLYWIDELYRLQITILVKSINRKEHKYYELQLWVYDQSSKQGVFPCTSEDISRWCKEVGLTWQPEKKSIWSKSFNNYVTKLKLDFQQKMISATKS